MCTLWVLKKLVDDLFVIWLELVINHVQLVTRGSYRKSIMTHANALRCFIVFAFVEITYLK